MARHKLNEKTCKALDVPGVYGDGDGLFLRVRPGGSRQWIFVYRWEGKRAEIGLGGYGGGTAPVSVALAREKADVLRATLARKEDPKAARKVGATFEEIMRDVIAVKAKSSKNAKHRDQWAMTLREYAKPLHGLPVAKVTIDDVVRTLLPIWESTPETADRTRMRIAAVMDAAKARGLFKGDNPAAWRGALETLLPARNRLSRGHHAALDYQSVPAVMKSLRESSAVSARAVELACLTACRSGEIRGAVWSEIDLDACLWTIPAARMKAGIEHRVPLSERAVAVLRSMQQRATGQLVFEGGKVGTAISDTAMVKSLRAASVDKTITLHGLRSSFRDWAGDTTAHPRDVIEMALAHGVKDKTEAAYRRLDALEKRKILMTDWGGYCQSAQ